jgi:transcriptional regulator with XRE-family HTH domain
MESIGERIKAVRQKQKLTLAKLAEKSNLSASHLSQVERNRSIPSLMTLASIAKALEVNLRDLLEAEENQVHITRASHRDEENGDVTSPVVMSPLTNLGNGWELEVHHLTLHPGGPRLDFEPYPGEILGFVQAGALMILVDDELFELQAGDSIHYDASQSHSLCCGGDNPCVVIWCNSPPRQNMAAKYEAGPKETSENISMVPQEVRLG